MSNNSNEHQTNADPFEVTADTSNADPKAIAELLERIAFTLREVNDMGRCRLEIEVGELE